MRLICLSILLVILLYAQSAFADCVVNSFLRAGSRGAEVKCLQKKVGAVTDGSFGPLTNMAVKAFQSNNGLVADGIVGPLTLSALNGVLVDEGNYPAGCTSTIGYSTTTGAKCDGSSNFALDNPLVVNDNNKFKSSVENANSKNPNLVNLDQFIETIVEVNKKSGSDEKELELISNTLRQAVLSSNVDYKEKFKELLANESKLSVNLDPAPSIFGKVITKALSWFGINPPVAQAQAVALPFGGALLLPFPCAGSWMLVITPLPPTNVKVLSYYPETQGFASYNIPFTEFLLGTYVPVGVCSYGLVNIKTEGTITPMVGSSPLP